MSRYVLSVAVAVVLLVGFVVYAQTNSAPTIGTFKDSRDGKTYKTVNVGGKTWMAQNLNFAAKGSKCYAEGGVVVVGWDDYKKPITTKISNAKVQAICAEYGRLYVWETANKACPAGWRLPSDDEWTELENAVGDKAGKKLKAARSWEEDYSSMDDYGWSALPGGLGQSDGSFLAAGAGGYWWSATDSTASSAWYRYMYYDSDYVKRSSYRKTFLLSVRCVQD